MHCMRFQWLRHSDREFGVGSGRWEPECQLVTITGGSLRTSFFLLWGSRHFCVGLHDSQL